MVLLEVTMKFLNNLAWVAFLLTFLLASANAVDRAHPVFQVSANVGIAWVFSVMGALIATNRQGWRPMQFAGVAIMLFGIGIGLFAPPCIVNGIILGMRYQLPLDYTCP